MPDASSPLTVLSEEEAMFQASVRRFAGERLALVQARFVFGVEGAAAVDVLEDAVEAFVVAHEQRAGGGAHEGLDAAAAGQAFEVAELIGVLVRGADVEGVVDVRPAPGAAELFVERLC